MNTQNTIRKELEDLKHDRYPWLIAAFLIFAGITAEALGHRIILSLPLVVAVSAFIAAFFIAGVNKRIDKIVELISS